MIFHFEGEDEEYPDVICNLDGCEIKNVKLFKYLGANIHFKESTTGDAEINQRIESAECKFYQHAKNLMNFKIALRVRVNIFNALTRSRLTYGCQTWTITTAQQSRLNSFYCGMLRRMIRGGYKRKEDRMAFVMTNEAILGLCKTDNVGSYIERLQQQFLAHIIRREDSAIVKQVTFNNDSVRRRGRYTTLRKQVLSRLRITPNEFYKRSMERVF